MATVAHRASFDGTSYWLQRWAEGGGPGKGSRGRLAAFKAEVLNAFVHDHPIGSIIEWGCGNGDQFALFRFPFFTGIEISSHAVAACRARFAGRDDCQFFTVEDAKDNKADLALSLDVIYHLTDDGAYESYMRRLFTSSNRYVIIYSSNWNGGWGKDRHVRHRRFTDWIRANATEWKLVKRIKNRYPRRPLLFLRQSRSFCDFYIFERT
jgi:SAM-dependent methyltransferase